MQTHIFLGQNETMFFGIAGEALKNAFSNGNL